jgi:hypothetical protein
MRGGRSMMMQMQAKHRKKDGLKQFKQKELTDQQHKQRKHTVDRNEINNTSQDLDTRVEIVLMHIKRSVVYALFMGFFTLLCFRGLLDPNMYYLSNAIRSQLENNEFQEIHSPTLGKSFANISTVEEWYQWLQVSDYSVLKKRTIGFLILIEQGPLTNFVTQSDNISKANLHNSTNAESFNNHHSILQYSTLLGAVRISQLRVAQTDCSSDVPMPLRDGGDFSWYCFSAETKRTLYGYFNPASELTEDFGDFGFQEVGNNGTNETIRFRYNGIAGETGMPMLYASSTGFKKYSVQAERKKYLNSFTTGCMISCSLEALIMLPA